MAKILIVDDSPTVTTIFTQLFQAEGHEVLTAGDGLSALNLARKERPDLLILDLMLPKMNGFEVCQMLKGDERFRATKVLMLTGRADEESRGLSKQTGADEYCTKDADPSQVMEAARRLLEGHVVR